MLTRQCAVLNVFFGQTTHAIIKATIKLLIAIIDINY